jgi:adenine-specific DNA methylase
MEEPGIPSGDGAKALGAFYTDAQIADFLVWWAVRAKTDTVLDPSFGGGVFLRSACFRLQELGRRPASQVFGVEIDEDVLQTISEKLVDEFGIHRSNLLLADFFDVSAVVLAPVDAVVGNPPFIRYQRFTGPVRQRAIKRAEEEGVRLSRLSSSWAPFLVHSARMLKDGGRLAMVVPMEIGHASYARPILNHLLKAFAEVTFLTFRKKLFLNLSEDTLLLLADRKGSGPARLYTRDLDHSGSLAAVIRSGRRSLTGRRRLK